MKTTQTQLPFKNKMEIAQKLEEYHSLFRFFWDYGNIVFTNEKGTNTAKVVFNDEGECIDFVFNEVFWNNCSEYERLFVISHKMLHLILCHGKRIIKLKDHNPKAVNIALDVVVNESLVKNFKFNRHLIKFDFETCWLNTVWKNAKTRPPTDKSFEYYYDKIEKDQIEQEIGIIEDSHDFLYGENSKDEEKISKYVEELIENNKELFNDLLEEMGKTNEESQQAGNTSGSWTEVNVKSPTKKKWESVINKWTRKTLIQTIKNSSRWDIIDRRFYETIEEMPDIALPTEVPFYDNHFENNKILVFFFLDVSGSCYHLKERFVKTANSLDLKKFDIKLFSFDTQVHEINYNRGGSTRIYGGGGTSFHPIESKIQEVIKRDKKKYPKAVWIITDGHGTNVKPEKPKNWYWFLTERGSKSNIPKESKVFNLEKYE